MFKWQNLYCFSQLGWENFNHVFTTVYFILTNHGGRRHAGTSKSKLLGIGRWLQRRLLWMVGVGAKIFSSDSDQFNISNESSNTNTLETDVHA